MIILRHATSDFALSTKTGRFRANDRQMRKDRCVDIGPNCRPTPRLQAGSTTRPASGCLLTCCAFARGEGPARPLAPPEHRSGRRKLGTVGIAHSRTSSPSLLAVSWETPKVQGVFCAYRWSQRETKVRNDARDGTAHRKLGSAKDTTTEPLEIFGAATGLGFR
jgi:hypothetical protein